MILYHIDEGAHTWPDSPIIIGTTCQDFNASVEIWKFFSQFEKKELTASLDINKQNSTSISIYPLPFATQILDPISNRKEKNITIINALGEKVIERTELQEEKLIQLNLDSLHPHLYFIQLNYQYIFKILKPY